MAETKSALVKPGAAPGPARAVFLLALAAYLAITAYAGWRSPVLEPYSDMFDWVARWWTYRTDGDLWRFLMTPTNMHRPTLIMAVQGLDIAAFGASSLLFITVGAVALISSALLLARLAGQATPALALPLAGIAAMLSLMAGNVLDAVIPINTNYAMGLFLGLLAIQVSEPKLGEHKGLRRPAAALALFALAALGDAAALAVWPVLVFGAWRGRRGLGEILTVVVAGGVFVALYFWGQTLPPGGSANPLQAIAFALSVLALPWTRLAPGLGWILGLAFLAASVLAITLRGGPNAPRAERIATHMILFSCGVAAMAGLGRGGEAAAEAPLRYAVLMAPMHVGLLIVAGPWLARLQQARPGAVGVALAAVAVLMTAQQLAMARAAIATTDVTRSLLAQFKAGARTPAMAERLHPDLAHAWTIQGRMDREGLYQRELHRP